MRVLVTGSSGFIGTHLVDTLLDEHSVAGVDARSLDSRQEVPFYECDLLDRARLIEVVSECSPDAIVHLAARTDLDEQRSIEGYAANFDGVTNLIDAIRQCPSVRRCIFTSSQLVCGVGYVPQDDQEYRPNTLYGESKVLTEQIVRREDGGGATWCLVRPTTVWGPGMRPHYRRFLRMIDRGTYFHVGHRPLYKSYGYVGNVVFQYLELLQAPAEQIHRKTLYLADYEPLSLRAWADAFQRELGARPIWTCPEYAAAGLAAIGDVVNRVGFKRFPYNSFRLNNVLTEYVFDLAETERICGALPYDMEQGVKKTVAWLVDQQVVSGRDGAQGVSW